MFRLTDIMLQNFEKDLRRFHELFQGGRCQAWQLEELIAKSTKQTSERLILSGHRLSRFDGKLDEITDFLNTNKYLLVAVPYYDKHCNHGKQHNYQILYIDA
ncbi:MAG: hypothetical protein K2P99_00750 [Burkholderiales bacterium]|nr:hypothetical protein [Burkholderiales bacterium]